MRGVCRLEGGEGGFLSCGCDSCGCSVVLDVEGVNARWLASEPATMALVSDANGMSAFCWC